MPLMNAEVHQTQKLPESVLREIENEISVYEDSSNTSNETFQIFSQSDNDDDQQPPTKRPNLSSKSSSGSAFNRIKTSIKPNSASKFQETITEKPKTIIKPPVPQQNPSINKTEKIAPTSVTNNVAVPVTEVDLIQIVEKPIGVDVNVDGEFSLNIQIYSIFLYIYKIFSVFLIDLVVDEFFSVW